MLISIVTASYNYENFIAETIQSVLNQTYQNWELIIVDDCSTDNSVEIIQSFCKQDKRIKLVQNNENVGLQKTILHALNHTNGQWIAFLESDDLWCENCLERRISTIKKYPQMGLIFNNVEPFGEIEGRKALIEQIANTHKTLKAKTFPKNMLFDFGITNKISTFSSVMIRKENLRPEYLKTPIDKLLDWWLYIHIANDCEFYYLEEKLTKWRLHPNSYISKPTDKIDFINLQAYFDVLKNYNHSIKYTLFFIYNFIIFVLYRLLLDKGQRIRTIRKIKKMLKLPLKENSPF